MSTLKVDNIRHNNATSDALVLSNDGSVAIGTCTAKLTSVGGAPLSNRNKVINGAMTISQRGTSFSGITGNSGTTHTLDRFKIQMNDFDQAVVTVSQDSSAPDGFAKSLKIQCTTAETSVENYEYARLIYDGEAFDFTDIGYGTSSSKKVTLSFWVKSNLTGTWGINFWRGDANRSNLRTYTINSANTWEHKVITLVEDTTGGVVNSDNGHGLRVNWGLAVGTNYAQSHALDTWYAFNSSYFFPYDARNTNLFSSTSNNFYLTGVQLEVGDTATSFEHRNYGDELSRCQRYYQQFVGLSDQVCLGFGRSNGTTVAEFNVPLSVPLRASPTLNACSWAVFTATNQSNSASQTPAVRKWDPHSNMLGCALSGMSGMTNARTLTVFLNNSDTFKMDAEI